MPRSITRRLLVSNLLVLAVFLGLTGATLDRAFRNSSEAALRERLQAHVYTLLATADADARGRMRLPEALSAPAFNAPDSGLYAEVLGEDGGYRWQSASLLGGPTMLTGSIAPGSSRFDITGDVAVFRFGVAWEDDAGKAIPYTLAVASDTATMLAEVTAFRNTLWSWLGGLAALLLGMQLLLLRWGLGPLHAMSAAVRRIERGDASTIDGPVPVELESLSNSLGALIRHNEGRQQRIRNSLADLAHSMKTPLAVLRGSAARASDPEVRQALIEQTERIDQIVSYQRHRAAVAGSGSVTRRIELLPIVERLLRSLEKVHGRRGVHGDVTACPDTWLRADEGDMLELFGNLLENAFRFARSRVSVNVTREQSRLVARIDDDGPGIAAEDVDRLLQRGQRADQHHPGEGIGLAVVSEVVRQYQGSLFIERAGLGGASIKVGLPL